MFGDAQPGQFPQAANPCNSAKENPTILSCNEARRLFHASGHELSYQVLSNMTCDSGGTGFCRIIPPALQTLAELATHAETDAPMPREMLSRFLKAANFNMIFQTVEYVAPVLLAPEFRTGDAPEDSMVEQMRVLARTGMADAIGTCHATPQITHVFADDGYSLCGRR
ncbi:MAG: hypothetical protein GDA36_03855 [Rhodobacteraceae bacterium]|nr:hypothetical protein [Paracoccaceae bacterium]